MKIEVGQCFLITTSEWFFAPDGRTYRAVWGRVVGIWDDLESLGVKTNSRSTNWYIEIGDTIVAGCQVHYAVRCDVAPPPRVEDQTSVDGKVVDFTRKSWVWDAESNREREVAP